MLTKLAAALLATSLIAGSAMAAQPSGATGSNGTAPAVQTQSPSPAATKANKTVKHAARHRSHVRKHAATVMLCIMRGMPPRPRRIRLV